MTKINLNKAFPSIEDSKKRLKELRCKKREIEIKYKMNAPLTDEEYEKYERIDVDIEQVEYLIDWMEKKKEDEDDDWDNWDD